LLAEAPTGVSVEPYERIAECISAAKGISVAEKAIEYSKSLEGPIKEGADSFRPLMQGNSLTFTEAKRTIPTHFTIIHSVYHEATAASNFRMLNISGKEFQENLQSTVLLKFGGEKFSLSMYHPKINSTVNIADIKSMLGEAERMDWQKKNFQNYTDAEDLNNFIKIKRILHYIWVPLSTIGITGLGATINEFITGLDQWGERACATSSVIEAITQFQNDAFDFRTMLMANRNVNNDSPQLPAFVKSKKLTGMLDALNKTSRADMQRTFALHTKAQAMFGEVNASTTVKSATQDAHKQMTKLLQDMKQEFGQSQATKTKQPPTVKSPKSVAFQTQDSGPTSTELYAMGKTLWATKFGQKTVKGKALNLCWHRCNAPQGCNKGNQCKQSHQAFPEAYNNGPISKLPIETQWSILKSCTN